MLVDLLTLATEENVDLIVKISPLELWVLRGFGLAFIAALAWFGSQFQTALIHIAEIRKELEVAKPVKILSKLTELEIELARSNLTKAEFDDWLKRFRNSNGELTIPER